MDKPVLYDFLPAEYHLRSRLVGKLDWVHWNWVEDHWEWAINEKLLNGHEAKEWVKRIKHGPTLLYVWACSRFAASPKTVSLSPEQVTALANVEVNLPLSAYEQPYPTMIVRIAKQNEGVNVLLNFDKEKHWLTCHMEGGIERRLIFNSIHGENTNIEAELHRLTLDMCPGEPEVEHQIAALSFRIAINAMLMLTNFGYTRQYAHPLKVSELLRDTKKIKTNPKRAFRAEEALAREEEVISFAQDIKFHEVRGEPNGQSSGEGNGHKKPHWRKGHWRNQAFGKGWSERKNVFIKPVLIHEEQFKGDLADCITEYSA